MLSGAIFCLTFLVWGCLAQANQTSSIQGHDEDNNGDTMVRAININDGALLETEINQPLLGEFVKNIPSPLQPIESSAAVIKKKRSLYSKNEPIVEDTLEAHNKYRELHGVPPLKLDDKMNKEATEWAESLAEAGRFEFPSTSSYGVNIFRGDEKCPYFKNSLATDAWYRGIKDFPFGVEPTEAKGTNFAQVVWKSTKLLGVGIGRKGRHIYVVAFYSPRGNQFGQFVKNVPPPLQPSEAGVKRSRVMYSNELSSIPAFNGTREQFDKEYLDAHNELRALHGCPPLKLDPKLMKSAQDYAEELARKKIFQHKKNNPYAENLWATSLASDNSRIKARSPVYSWYSEIEKYNFGSNDNDFMKTGHFTQVVWKNTKLAGVGVARNKDNIYVVGHYSPYGNYPGGYVENVPPLLNKQGRAGPFYTGSGKCECNDKKG